MGKILFVLELPEPAPRKAQAPPTRKHKNKKLYSRKEKHKKPLCTQGFFVGLRTKPFCRNLTAQAARQAKRRA